MITKIISGGQTGVDRAALDVAIQFGMPYGGWIPKGRKTEKGRLPDKYLLNEMPTDSYHTREANNVLYSDGTLIVSHGIPSDESALAVKFAALYRRPWLHMDLNQRTITDAVGVVSSWIRMQRIRILNVTGSTASEDPRIYQDTVFLLRGVVRLLFRKGAVPVEPKAALRKPSPDEDLIEELISKLSLKDKVSIANMDNAEIRALHLFFDTHIRDKINMDSGDREYARIMNALWKRLCETYRLRVVK